MLIAATVLLQVASTSVAGERAAVDTDVAEFSFVRTGAGLTNHKEMFMVPLSWSENYDGEQSEVIFQLSAKHRVFGSRFYLAYSQISFWQAYDKSNSSPFRDTNYNPEVFYRFAERRLGDGLLGMDAGFEHQSNGRLVGDSRSWNLLYAAPYWRSRNWLIYAKARYRIPESEKETPDSAVGDDNPDITEYLGYSDIHVVRTFRRGQQLRLLVRGYIGRSRGLIEATFSVPVPGDSASYFCLKASEGYGESLLDYNRSNTRVSLGIMFNR